MQFQAVTVQAGKIQDVVDQGQKGRAGLAHGLHMVALLRIEAGLQGDVGQADDGVERRADLVAHARQKRALGPGRLLGLLLGPHQFAFHGPKLGDVHEAFDEPPHLPGIVQDRRGIDHEGHAQAGLLLRGGGPGMNPLRRAGFGHGTIVAHDRKLPEGLVAQPSHHFIALFAHGPQHLVPHVHHPEIPVDDVDMPGDGVEDGPQAVVQAAQFPGAPGHPVLQGPVLLGDGGVSVLELGKGFPQLAPHILEGPGQLPQFPAVPGGPDDKDGVVPAPLGQGRGGPAQLLHRSRQASGDEDACHGGQPHGHKQHDHRALRLAGHPGHDLRLGNRHGHDPVQAQSVAKRRDLEKIAFLLQGKFQQAFPFDPGQPAGLTGQGRDCGLHHGQAAGGGLDAHEGVPPAGEKFRPGGHVRGRHQIARTFQEEHPATSAHPDGAQKIAYLPEHVVHAEDAQKPARRVVGRKRCGDGHVLEGEMPVDGGPHRAAGRLPGLVPGPGARVETGVDLLDLPGQSGRRDGKIAGIAARVRPGPHELHFAVDQPPGPAKLPVRVAEKAVGDGRVGGHDPVEKPLAVAGIVRIKEAQGQGHGVPGVYGRGDGEILAQLQFHPGQHLAAQPGGHVAHGDPAVEQGEAAHDPGSQDGQKYHRGREQKPQGIPPGPGAFRYGSVFVHSLDRFMCAPRDGRSATNTGSRDTGPTHHPRPPGCQRRCCGFRKMPPGAARPAPAISYDRMRQRTK
ncbi:hypothetical protein ASZ90_000539 [hydrocarbon metagenome]|uniref:Uncharacterized protein n=1 Tax=hydrocarbon metagenome TaxID=938273 RepID=A0A0W8G965_9ZZZZ